MNLDKENIKKIMLLITFTLVLAMCLYNFGKVIEYVGVIFAVLTPFIIGGAMAFVVNIPMNIIEKFIFGNKYLKNNKIAKKLSRPISLILAFVFILGLAAVVIGVVVPDLYSNCVVLSKTITKFIPKMIDFVNVYIGIDAVNDYMSRLQNLDWLSILNEYMKVLTTGAGSVINTTMDMISSVMSTTITIVIATVFCFYILAQKEMLGLIYKKILRAFLSNNIYNYIVKVSKLTHKTFTNYITGQCLDAFILGLMFFVVLIITGMPYALLIGVLIGFTALIPLVGSFVGCVISAFLMLMVSPVKCIIFLVIFVILQQIEENFVYPKVVGSSVGLPSIWVLVAVTVGGSLWGVIGMIIFIPLFSVIYALFREYVNKRLVDKNYI